MKKSSSKERKHKRKHKKEEKERKAKKDKGPVQLSKVRFRRNFVLLLKPMHLETCWDCELCRVP